MNLAWILHESCMKSILQLAWFNLQIIVKYTMFDHGGLGTHSDSWTLAYPAILATHILFYIKLCDILFCTSRQENLCGLSRTVINNNRVEGFTYQSLTIHIRACNCLDNNRTRPICSVTTYLTTTVGKVLSDDFCDSQMKKLVGAYSSKWNVDKE